MKKTCLIFVLSSLFGLASVMFGYNDDVCSIALRSEQKIFIFGCNPATLIKDLGSHFNGSKETFFGEVSIEKEDHDKLHDLLLTSSAHIFTVNLETEKAVIKECDHTIGYIFSSPILLALFKYNEQIRLSNEQIRLSNEQITFCSNRRRNVQKTLKIVNQTTDISSSSSETNSEESSGSSDSQTNNPQLQPKLASKPQQKISRIKNFLVYVPLGFVLGVLPFYIASRLGHWDSSFASPIDAHFMQLFASIQTFAFRK